MAEIKAPVDARSPCIFIYKPMLTMLMSIAHRISGPLFILEGCWHGGCWRQRSVLTPMPGSTFELVSDV
jgi:hypothetical protein